MDRAHKSLKILHKDNIKDKRRVPRSRSVHTIVHADPSPSRASTSSPSPSGSSRFTRTKSVTHMSPSVSSIRDLTWSVLRRNDPVHCTSPRVKPPQDPNKTHDDAVYQEPKQSELNPDEIPPEKLSQEAFRCAREISRNFTVHHFFLSLSLICFIINYYFTIKYVNYDIAIFIIISTVAVVVTRLVLMLFKNIYIYVYISLLNLNNISMQVTEARRLITSDARAGFGESDAGRGSILSLPDRQSSLSRHVLLVRAQR